MEGHDDHLEDIRRTSETSETINTIPEKGKYSSEISPSECGHKIQQ